MQQLLQAQMNQFDGRISVVVEMDDVSFSYQENEVFSSASLIKIPIMLAAFRQYERGLLHFERMIEIPRERVVGGAGVLQALSEGICFSIKDLLTLMMIVSDNTATNLLIDIIGKEKIQLCMEELGLQHTVLKRKMMDFEAIARGENNVTSAVDMIRCLKIILEEGNFSLESRREMLTIMQQQQFTSKLPALMDTEQVKVANKTGELSGVEHDCAIIQFGDKIAIVAVLMEAIVDIQKSREIMSRIGKIVYDELVK